MNNRKETSLLVQCNKLLIEREKKKIVYNSIPLIEGTSLDSK